MITTSRSVGVEVRGLHPVFLQIFSRGTVFFDRSCWRDVVSSYAVSEKREHTRVFDLLDRSRLHVHVIKVRCALDVRGVSIPGIGLALGHGHSAPALVAL